MSNDKNDAGWALLAVLRAVITPPHATRWNRPCTVGLWRSPEGRFGLFGCTEAAKSHQPVAGGKVEPRPGWRRADLKPHSVAELIAYARDKGVPFANGKAADCKATVAKVVGDKAAVERITRCIQGDATPLSVGSGAGRQSPSGLL